MEILSFCRTSAAGETYAPWRLDIKDTKITWMGSIPHSRDSQVDAWNEGHHDRWIDAKRSQNPEYGHMPITMGHYTRDDLPFYYAMADAFTVCDQNYCAAMTSTTPNWLFFWTGTVRDEQHAESRVFMRNDQIMIGGQKWKTFPERLQDADVSWLSSPEHFSDHPTSPWYGAWYVSEVMDILTKNPEVWKKTIFILTYDENDGYFDHAPSYVAADPKRPETGKASSGIDTALDYMYKDDELAQGVSPEEARSGPIGMGFRVPMVVASPWSRGGWVNSQLFDHTSMIQFLEGFVKRKTGKTVYETNISAWRRSIAGDLTSCFRTYSTDDAKLDYLDRDKFVVQIREARDKQVPANFKALTAEQIAEVNQKLAASQWMSKQEPGTRPANPLPYELYADGMFSADGNSFVLTMKAATAVHGTKSMGAPFNVYLRHNGSMVAGTYTVKAGDTLTQSFPLNSGKYLIDVHAPNGFFRSFNGTVKTPATVQASYEQQGGRLNGNIALQVKNSGKTSVQVTVKDNSYGLAPVIKNVAAGTTEKMVMWSGKSHGWYDVSVRAEDSEARYAGHVECGSASITDPAMGEQMAM
jgi:phospholipase C